MMPVSLHQMLYAVALSLLGAGSGFALGYGIFQDRYQPREYQGQYFGGLPVIGAALALLLVPDLKITGEIIAVVGVVTAFAVLGMIRDFTKIPLSGILPYQILLIIIGVFFGLDVPHPVRGMWVLLSLIWPMTIMYCLKLASLVYEMPFLLCIGSSVTFLLFFPHQQATPPWVVILTIGLMIVTGFCLFFLWKGKKGFLGDSGLLAIGYLLVAISMLGRSKRLLMFALLVPSMVVIYPFVLISLLIMSSYLGNELYSAEGRDRKSNYRWNLSRPRLIVLSSLIFLCLNFLGLFLMVTVPWWAYVALFLLFVASVVSFVRTFAHKSSPDLPAEGSRIHILGIPIDVLTPVGVLNRFEEFLGARDGFHHVVTADSLAIFRAFKDKPFGRMVSRASLVLPDGAGLIWASDFLGAPLPSRVPGIALVSELCQRSISKGWSLYFLGAKPGVAQAAAQTLSEQHPGLNIAGTHHGFFHEGSPTEDAVIEDILLKKPDILLVALGVPKQELFIQRLRPLVTRAVAIGVGGSFDVLSGTLPRAPVFMQQFALEWLFRLWKEPRRLFRIMKIPWFVLAVIRAKWQEQEIVL
jgi:N-acetylglucosaminyldiphosphoundecaprenol N-acetyl-beta-D-mannosaminyltransferase